MSEQNHPTWKSKALVLLPVLYLATFGLAFWLEETLFPPRGSDEAPGLPFRKPTARFWIVMALAAVAYCIAYAADVTPSEGMVVAEDYDPGPDAPLDMTQISRFVDYRFGGNAAGLLFLPIHFVDRKLRPEVWGYYEP